MADRTGAAKPASEWTWGEIVDELAAALRLHRADMHQISDRPCSTCERSARVLAIYEGRRHHVI